MAISLRTDLVSKIIFLVGLSCSSVAVAASCDRISSTFTILHWQGELPKSVTVQILRRASGKQVEPGTPINFIPVVANSTGTVSGKYLKLTPELSGVSDFLAADDYRIVIDGIEEFVIHDIKLIDRPSLACPIQSAIVNECRLERDRDLNFDASCGRQLTVSTPKTK